MIRNSRSPLASGFTLIELMITVAVVAILASIALPSYQEQVRKTHRAQAKADLIEYAQLAERFHTVNNTYVGFTLPTTVSPREGAAVRYNLAFSPVSTQAAFTLLATVNGAQANDRCGNLGLNQAGVKTVTKSTVSDCW